MIAVSDFVTSEIMYDPAAVADTNGERFEIHNRECQSGVLVS
jgi:hypothetical protein